MAKDPQEWLLQAQYDLDTAEYMFSGERYFYAVFMCHLAIEKALKGLYLQKLGIEPPKTHNLIYLLNKIGIKPDESKGKFLIKLNEASVVTRYPENMKTLQKDFTLSVVKDILAEGKEALTWISNQY